MTRKQWYSSSLLAVYLLFMALCSISHGFTTTPFPWKSQKCSRGTSFSSLSMVTPKDRENEIRRKILKLKRQGRIQKSSDGEMDKLQKSKSSATDDYSQKLKAKLGRKKANMMGLTSDDDSEYDEIQAELDSYDDEQEEQKGQLGSLPRQETTSETEDDLNVVTSESTSTLPSSSSSTPNKPIIDPSLFDYKDDDTVEEPDEEDLVELVAQKLKEKRIQEQQQEEQARQERLDKLYCERQQQTTQQTTSGVGGTWSKANATAQNVETYQPKSGSWGAFPRPKDISKAYGGGRRVGAGFDESQLVASQQDTRRRLQQYRERVGIEVQSEKDHANEIEEALKLAGYAMQRGMYSSAVSCLEKVTKYCSTNSKVGGKVFLELAMAYEAEGRTQEAVTVYTTLSKSRIEEIKFDAKRLLYGIEAMQFMRNEARSEAFSRKRIRNTFIDTTGLENFAENFDDVYETAYIDLSSGFYRKLTESVVRSNREARQILLAATGSGMVEHLKIVQALRSISRHFDSALEEELKAAAPQSVAVMNGKPILQREESSVATVMQGMDEFVLASPKQMMEMLNGIWRLQLVADRQGDGVKYNNNSTFQIVDTNVMTFKYRGPSGFVQVSQRGKLDFDEEKRILTKTNINTSGGGVLSSLIGGKSSSVNAAQQVVSVDSTLLITRLAPDKKRSAADTAKGFFSVWRRVGSPALLEANELEVAKEP